MKKKFLLIGILAIGIVALSGCIRNCPECPECPENEPPVITIISPVLNDVDAVQDYWNTSLTAFIYDPENAKMNIRFLYMPMDYGNKRWYTILDEAGYSWEYTVHPIPLYRALIYKYQNPTQHIQWRIDVDDGANFVSKTVDVYYQHPNIFDP